MEKEKYWGKGEFANMPKEVMMKSYPKEYSSDPHLDDTIVRLDSDARSANKKIRKDMDRGMY